MNQIALSITEWQYGDFGAEGTGTLGDSTNPSSTLAAVISVTVAIMTAVAAFWFIFLVLTSALQIVTSGSDKASFESAKKRMTNGIIGLVVVLTAVILVNFVAQILDIQIVLILNTFIPGIF